jgi:hypothetical protein
MRTRTLAAGVAALSLTIGAPSVAVAHHHKDRPDHPHKHSDHPDKPKPKDHPDKPKTSHHGEGHHGEGSHGHGGD